MLPETELSIVVPCYNEAENIKEVFKKFSEKFSNKKEIEVVFVNNGSTDNSVEVLEKEKSKYPELNSKIVTVPKNLGYGFGILQGLDVAAGKILSWTHADLQTDPGDLERCWILFKTQERSKRFIVKGKRVNRPFVDQFFTTCMQLVVYFKTLIFVDDVNAQPKMFSREFLEDIKKISPPPYDFSLDLYLLLMAKKTKHKIIDFPVDFGKRLAGEAKGGGSFKVKMKLIKRTFNYIMNYKC